MRNLVFLILALVVGALVFLGIAWLENEYLFFAGYVVLQFVVLATALSC